MRSSELAALAGVTIRALRHYHQIGLLEEPERSGDDNREYEVRHLARLLRIVRLTELGVPLAELPEVLDDAGVAADLLDRLDEEAAAEIDRFTTRRAVIAVLRQHRAMPDLPPSAARYEAVLQAAADVAPDLVRYEREQLALLAHLVGEERTAALTRTLTQLAPLTPDVTALLRRFAALGPDTPEEEVGHVADAMADRYRPLLAALPGVLPGALPAALPGVLPDGAVGNAGAPLLAASVEQTYNEQQLRVLRALEERVHAG
ncbi:MerR family transcriptional regulator [Promicromonospora sukumoe]|uniref:MerR family transcriptional regulator n=1 Tax=Promicromonospora sukumoe TaxID=88382 RepID=UPI00365B1687